MSGTTDYLGDSTGLVQNEGWITSRVFGERTIVPSRGFFISLYERSYCEDTVKHKKITSEFFIVCTMCFPYSTNFISYRTTTLSQLDSTFPPSPDSTKF